MFQYSWKQICILIDNNITPPIIAGSGGGGGSSKQTVYQKAEPWEGMKPLAKSVANLGGMWRDWVADTVGKQGMDAIVWSYSDPRYRVADFNPAEIGAMNAVIGPEGNFANIQYLLPFYQAYMNPQQQTALTEEARMATNTGMLDIYNRALNEMDKYRAERAISSERAILPTLKGDYLSPQSNPYLRQTIEYATRPAIENLSANVLPQLQSSAASAGRYGSATMADLVKDAISTTNRQVSDTASQIAADNLARERALQMQTATLPYQMVMQGYQPLEAMVGMGQNRYALEKQYGLQQTQSMIDLINQAYRQVQAAAGAGEALRNMEQAKRDAEKAAFQEGIWSPYEIISALGNLAFTGGQIGRTMSTTVPQYSPSFAQQLASGLTGGLGMYGLASSIPGLSSVAPYLGAVYAGSMFM